MVNRLSPLLFERNCARQPLTDEQRARGLAKGCWLWRPDRSSHFPRGLVSISHSDGQGGGARWLAHRAAFEVFVGPVPEGMSACQRCASPRCCEPEHLYAGPAARNWQDGFDRGRHPRGPAYTTQRPRARKLSEADVRRVLTGGESAAAVAAALGIGRAYVSKLRSGKAKAAVATDVPRFAARRYGSASVTRG